MVLCRTRIQVFETDTEEITRLAQAPVGSKNHSLSLLPVTYAHPDKYHLVELPRLQASPCSKTAGAQKLGGIGDKAHECDGSHHMVVLPFRYDVDEPWKLPRRHDGSWECRVIASDNPAYPVGGFDLTVSDSELRRGRVLEL